jgi:redox-sensitive bicupin YhaK (pirin superfamily)
MDGAIAQLIQPQSRDLGDGFAVRRVLPAARARRVGPFVFFDEMGPVDFAPGRGLDVRPHPHIGLATVTWLFEGATLHRDSLGFVQRIEPGDVNWMTAGSGIVHSERTPFDLRSHGSRVHGIQTWVALPEDAEDVAPAFHHHPAATLPAMEAPGMKLHLIASTGFGLVSPVRVYSPMVYAAAELAGGACLAFAPEHEQRAVYLSTGSVRVGSGLLQPGQIAVLEPGREAVIEAGETTRLMLLGGAPLPGGHHLWRNFGASDPERIEAAKQRWRAGAFGAVPGEDELIPLPEK